MEQISSYNAFPYKDASERILHKENLLNRATLQDRKE